MTICSPCENLNRKPSKTPPHGALTEIERKSWARLTNGQAKGELLRYVCSTCGAKLARDCDHTDGFAIWEIVDTP